MEALSDGADGGILASAHVETETFAEIHRAWQPRANAMPRWRDGARLRN